METIIQTLSGNTVIIDNKTRRIAIPTLDINYNNNICLGAPMPKDNYCDFMVLGSKIIIRVSLITATKLINIFFPRCRSAASTTTTTTATKEQLQQFAIDFLLDEGCIDGSQYDELNCYIDARLNNTARLSFNPHQKGDEWCN